MERGYLDGWLERIDAVTPEQVNAAIREYLRPEDLKILVVAEGHRADEIAQQIRDDGAVFGKGPADYRLEQVELEDGSSVWQIPENRLHTIRKDAVWAHTPIGVAREDVRVVPVEALFETRAFIDEAKAQPDAR